MFKIGERRINTNDTRIQYLLGEGVRDFNVTLYIRHRNTVDFKEYAKVYKSHNNLCVR